MKSKYELFGKKISGIFTIPAGIVNTEAEVLEKIGNEIPEIGILTTKSIGPIPRAGYKEPIVAQYAQSSFINAVGLTNPGVDEFVRKLSKVKIPKNKFLLISIFGSNEDEFFEVAKKLVSFADGFELNISCPHSGKYGQSVGADNELVEKVTRRVVSLGKPTLVKISPNIDVEKTVEYALRGGASGMVAINTKGPVPYLHDGYPVLSNKVGGISGKAILELGLSCVRKIRQMTNLPIIACGGISTAKDLKRYKEAGANYFGIGSALTGFKTDEIKKYFYELSKDLEKDTNNAAKILKEKANMDYKKYKMKENKKLADDLFLLEFDGDIKIKPGQFIFAWLPEKGEKPFSVFDDKPMSLLIQKRGCFTNELSKLKKGNTVYIRGPYGNSPKISGKTLLVGGGTGMASLYLFAKRNKKTVALLGARDKNHLIYEKFKNVCKEIYLTTDNGEIGQKGLITDNLGKMIKDIKPQYCINCGPEPMIRKAIQIEKRKISSEKIYSSIDFLTKCGVGLCGSCTSSKGFRSCVDGTFLKPNQIY
ncbi:MAG: tRNA-dihydrouridine synthase [Candidatus Daviesbacteria bacterium]|nr:tRNA-dihydrouridine synthase [Candidatus Daviesbacteria bacterium]